MRSRALAAAFNARGHDTVFVPQADVAAQAASLVVIDSYAVSCGDISRWAQIAPVCVIDDLGDRDLSSAAAIINQNFGASVGRYASGPLLLLGPQFALLREQFRDARRARTFQETDRRVLVTLGGGDTSRSLDELVTALKRIPRDLEIVTLGGRSRRDDVATLMAGADLAVTAAGVTMLELSAVGTPAILTTIAANQEPGAAAMAAANLGILAGPFESTLPLIPGAVERLLRDTDRRRQFSEAMMKSVDGDGARRAADALEAISRK